MPRRTCGSEVLVGGCGCGRRRPKRMPKLALAATALLATGTAGAALSSGPASGPPPCGYEVEYYVAPGCGIFEVATYGFGVNDAGVVVGKLHGCPQSGQEKAFVWWPDGSVQVIDLPWSSEERAWDVNEKNQVMLEIVSPMRDEGYVAAIWEAGEVTVMGLPDWAGTGKGAAINDLGVIAGEFGNIVTGPYPLACTWSAAEGLEDLSGLFEPSNQRPVGITNMGVIAGWTTTFFEGENILRAFILNAGVVTDLGPVPGCVNSIAKALGEAGHVVGYGHTGITSTHPWKGFVWHQGTMSLLPPLPLEGHDETIPNDVNSAGVVVGKSRSSRPIAGPQATIWFDGKPIQLSTLVDLPPSSTVSTPNAISNTGVIAGYGTHMGYTRAFRLTPKPVLAADVDGDCQVDGADLAMLLKSWGAEGADLPEDVDGSGVVDGGDLGILLAEWTG